jgi:hypothetical protein
MWVRGRASAVASPWDSTTLGDFMHDDLSSLVVALSKSADFEEAAARALSSLMHLTEEAIGASKYRGAARCCAAWCTCGPRVGT